MLEGLVAALTRRIDAFELKDPGPVLDPQALAEARELLDQAATCYGTIPPHIVWTVGRLHLCRAEADADIPHGSQESDLMKAVELFATIAEDHPEAVPEEIRPWMTLDRTERKALLGMHHAAGHGRARMEPPRTRIRMGPYTLIGVLPPELAVPLLREHARGDVSILAGLAEGLYEAYEESGVVTYLHEAVTAFRQLCEALPRDSPDHPRAAGQLANCLRTRHEQTGSVADLEAALAEARAAVNATPSDDPAHQVQAINYALVLESHYEYFGDIASLDQAISLLQQAADVLPAEHPGHRAALGNLSYALSLRHGHAGDSTDMTTMVRIYRQLWGTASADENQKTRRRNLAASLNDSYEQSGNPTELNEAITLLRENIKNASAGHPDLAADLANLALALRLRFLTTHAVTDLDDAVTLLRRAIDLLPADHPHRARQLSNLSLVLQTRFLHTAAPADLEEAVTSAQAAVQATPVDHLNYVGRLHQLALTLQTRWFEHRRTADLVNSTRGFARVLRSTNAPITHRLHAGMGWVRGPLSTARFSAAVRPYTETIQLLPLLAWRGLSHRDRLARVGQVNGFSYGTMTRNGAACAIDTHQLTSAVEMLETGRGVYWGQLLDTRSDLTALWQVAPDLAAQLAKSRAAIDQDAPASDSVTETIGTVTDRMDAARRFDAVVAQVRALPASDAFPHPERFLAPPDLDTLRPRPSDGPVVIVNVSALRCDALLLTHQDLTAVPLMAGPTTISEETTRHLAALTEYHQSRRTPADRLCLEMAITATLEWLWDTIAAPVLHALGHTHTPTTNWPRLWWCPTGPLTHLPLHAAGYHGTGETVMDRVVSSYTPTLRALTHARERDHSRQPPRMLTITLPETPGQSPLPGAATERDLLTTHFSPDWARTDLTGPAATRATILENLAGHRWLHASCHGTQDPVNPADGGLLPHDWDTAAKSP